MMRHIRLYILIYLLVTACATEGQRDLRIMFYNTENLFDTEDDPEVNDNEFLPNGIYAWSYKKYEHKLHNIYKVITAIGEWTPPEIIAFCEIENAKVLTDLISNTPLSKYHYNMVHYNSPDPRGIDVALIYKSDILNLISKENIPVVFPEKYKDHKTRNILMAKFSKDNHALYIFVNHWPSRRSGEKESDPFRFLVSKILKHKTDSVLKVDKSAKIIIVGDFNDEPGDESIQKGLLVNSDSQKPQKDSLYNLSAKYIQIQKTGTIKHQGKWMIFDQIIVNGNLINNTPGFHTSPDKSKVFNADFILQPDRRYLGFTPFRTFSGRKYIGGYSDHLPVYLDLSIINN